MKRRGLFSTLALALVVSAPAFADTDTGHAGDYGNTSLYAQSNGPRTRAEVRAELEQSQRDGTVAYIRKATSYAQGLDLVPRPYRPTPEGNQLAGAGR
ncbi:hypothetical protein BGV47_18355 [Burkholderia ubonensis]|uniref:DUF4148 domain-containing protein n=1 Tax=Burkholderia ubonensis TaxID=101571 RepID=UPI0008FE944E|nr:DUF4148 domain-containing protein [Burkholderia ubonensis]OJA37169.1 hypothetical protein BGV47_18355 [Burkholderia ubonensis]OJB27263.1 hypothetical protein BGV55_18050 [Burkholderia ubonensis]